ncbi:hypothetical protein KH5_03110 [Urechidicola sp. KH5]
MRKQTFLSLIIGLISFNVLAQSELNAYKYVVVPIRYDFQKKDDAFQVNSLTKFLFEKEGFATVLSSDTFPDDLKVNNCLAVTARLIDGSSMFTTKMHFELVDCNNKVVYTTKEARSKEKDYKRAYHAAVRASLQDLNQLNYAYESETISLEPSVTAKVTQSSEATRTVSKNVNIVANKNETPPNNSTMSSASVTAPVIVKKPEVKKQVDKNVLYAQEIENGYQLVDSTPKVVYKAYGTSIKDVYIIKDGNGIIYKNGTVWVAEYYEGDTLIQKELNIKLL